MLTDLKLVQCSTCGAIKIVALEDGSPLPLEDPKGSTDCARCRIVDLEAMVERLEGLIITLQDRTASLR